MPEARLELARRGYLRRLLRPLRLPFRHPGIYFINYLTSEARFEIFFNPRVLQMYIRKIDIPKLFVVTIRNRI